MWLINASTYVLEYFIDDSVTPPYAILSHTWEHEEVLYRDIDNIKVARSKAGFKKIQYTCEQAIQDDLTHAWVDTCCIDKSSSAELSEAINSMYALYQKSARC
jgi:hypothetical protein